MALAKVEITCTHCGKTFEARKTCYNRKDADNYEAWALENISLCPECRAAQKAAEQEAAAQRIAEALPTIEGVSDKQIAFAASLRAKYIANNANEVNEYRMITRKLTAEEQAALEAACKENGIDPAEAVRYTIKEMQLEKIEAALTETSARKIIDMLK